MEFKIVYGVDFSGAKRAGRNTWVARLEPAASGSAELIELASLEDLCGTAERVPALAHLVGLIQGSDQALWTLDFPFGLPIEIMAFAAMWPAQLALLRAWGEDAAGFGRECLRRAKALGGPGHIRRLTDVEAKTPFDSYHYRIIYQTFHGMRDVLDPLRGSGETAILPFQYRRLPSARRVLVEACPASTLKRLGLPYRRYKQPGGATPDAGCLHTRQLILAGLAEHVTIPQAHREIILDNCGGDALDAVIAAVGALETWQTADHRLIARHDRYVREGRVYA